MGGWALTMTGHPAASADAVSPPGTEKAKRKVSTRRRPATVRAVLVDGAGRAAGSHGRIPWRGRCSLLEPSITHDGGKEPELNEVRRSSPVRRPSPKPVSSFAVAMISAAWSSSAVSDGLEQPGAPFERTNRDSGWRQRRRGPPSPFTSSRLVSKTPSEVVAPLTGFVLEDLTHDVGVRAVTCRRRDRKK